MSAKDSQKTSTVQQGSESNNAAPHGIQKQRDPAARDEKETREQQEGKPAVLPKKG
jgi:hypothetical protein